MLGSFSVHLYSPSVHRSPLDLSTITNGMAWWAIVTGTV
jgi:hypothetical protein